MVLTRHNPYASSSGHRVRPGNVKFRPGASPVRVRGLVTLPRPGAPRPGGSGNAGLGPGALRPGARCAPGGNRPNSGHDAWPGQTCSQRRYRQQHVRSARWSRRVAAVAAGARPCRCRRRSRRRQTTGASSSRWRSRRSWLHAGRIRARGRRLFRPQRGRKSKRAKRQEYEQQNAPVIGGVAWIPRGNGADSYPSGRVPADLAEKIDVNPAALVTVPLLLCPGRNGDCYAASLDQDTRGLVELGYDVKVVSPEDEDVSCSSPSTSTRSRRA